MIHAELMSEPRSWQGLRAAPDGAFRRYGDPACARKQKPSHRPSPEQGGSEMAGKYAECPNCSTREVGKIVYFCDACHRTFCDSCGHFPTNLLRMMTNVTNARYKCPFCGNEKTRTIGAIGTDFVFW
jgi:ribosomal protein L37AE/L43A